LPFTPFHFGPALLLKGAGPRRFSWTAFAAAQVLIDIEPLSRTIMEIRPAHGLVHTIPVATGVGLAAGVGTAVLGRALLRRRSKPPGPRLKAEATLSAALWGGALGGASHPVLDAVIHGDVAPFWPLVHGDPILGWVSPGVVILSCVAMGVAGYFLLMRPPEETISPTSPAP
jgi:hypothetical protein